MCDTMVALEHTTKSGSIIFAKNSDRQPNEPLLLMHYPAKTYQAGSKLQCTYIEIDQVDQTYAISVHQPAWMWGCEMGTNEHGLTIGNEAVFTKEKVSKTGLLGMDLVRLALERCKTSEEAVYCITDLLATYGQGGNCGYEKPFSYHNSYLIADYKDAWVLETAGEYWVAEKVKGVRAISNRLSIGEHYDLTHPDVISYATDKGWHKKGNAFHFAKSYSDFLYTSLSGSKERHHCALNNLNRQLGQITEQTMMHILQSHVEETTLPPLHSFSVKSVCMHAGFLYGDQTTGSYVIQLNPAEPLIGWVTGSSTACISLFKAVQLFDSNQENYGYTMHPEQALHFWLTREDIHRRLMKATGGELTSYHEQRDNVQYKIFSAFEKGDFHLAWDLEAKFIKQQKHALTPYTTKWRQGNLYYRRYWDKQNKRLYEKHADYFNNEDAVSKV